MAEKTYNPTWFERGTNPDLITRGLSIGSGAPTDAPDVNADDSAYQAQPVAPWMTQPAMRPTVNQRMLNFLVPAGTPAVALANGRTEAIAVIFNVYSTAAASAFWGPAGVTATTGVEIRPGFPAVLTLDQNREQWELQRQLEFIAAVMAAQTSNQPLGAYKAPRVIFDISQIYLASAATQNVTVIVFLPPEQQ